MSDERQQFTPVPVFMQQNPPMMSRAEAVVPARVRVALEYLNLVNSKTMVRVAATEHVIQEIAGQELTTEEASAQATACNMLEHYFAGKMPADFWERLDAQDRAHERGECGTVVPCFACRNGMTIPPQKPCCLCRGNGFIYVTPAVMDEVEAGTVNDSV